MLHILSNYGVPEEIIKAISVMFNNPTCLVQTPDGPTEAFTTTTGILRGNTLAPFLFYHVGNCV